VTIANSVGTIIGASFIYLSVLISYEIIYVSLAVFSFLFTIIFYFGLHDVLKDPFYHNDMIKVRKIKIKLNKIKIDEKY